MLKCYDNEFVQLFNFKSVHSLNGLNIFTTTISADCQMFFTECSLKLNKSIENAMDCDNYGFHIADNGVCYNDSTNSTPVGFWNATLAEKSYGLKSRLPSEEYLE